MYSVARSTIIDGKQVLEWEISKPSTLGLNFSERGFQVEYDSSLLRVYGDRDHVSEICNWTFFIPRVIRRLVEFGGVDLVGGRALRDLRWTQQSKTWFEKIEEDTQSRFQNFEYESTDDTILVRVDKQEWVIERDRTADYFWLRKSNPTVVWWDENSLYVADVSNFETTQIRQARLGEIVDGGIGFLRDGQRVVLNESLEVVEDDHAFYLGSDYPVLS